MTSGSAQGILYDHTVDASLSGDGQRIWDRVHEQVHMFRDDHLLAAEMLTKNFNGRLVVGGGECKASNGIIYRVFQ